MQLQIQEQRKDGVVILAPEGRLDSGKIDQFERAIQERIRKGHHRLLIDCSNLVFAASSALRILLVTVRKLNEVGGKLALCNMNPHILGIFKNAGFTRLMNIQESFDEGLAAVRPPQAERPPNPRTSPSRSRRQHERSTKKRRPRTRQRPGARASSSGPCSPRSGSWQP